MFSPDRFPARECGGHAFVDFELPGGQNTLPQHKVFSRKTGMTDEEIQAVTGRD
jgi:hypothetical protein